MKRKKVPIWWAHVRAYNIGGYFVLWLGLYWIEYEDDVTGTHVIHRCVRICSTAATAAVVSRMDAADSFLSTSSPCNASTQTCPSLLTSSSSATVSSNTCDVITRNFTQLWRKICYSKMILHLVDSFNWEMNKTRVVKRWNLSLSKHVLLDFFVCMCHDEFCVRVQSWNPLWSSRQRRTHDSAKKRQKCGSQNSQ